MNIAFLDQTNEPSGGTAVKFLSPRSMPSAAGTPIKFLCEVTEPASGIVPVGSKEAGAFVDGSTPLLIPLHPNSQAGDVVLLSLNCQPIPAATPSFVPPTGSEPIIPVSTYTTNQFVALYLYTLTAADITAGSLTVSGIPRGDVSGTASVWRNANGSGASVVGVLVTHDTEQPPVSMTTTGVTLPTDGILVYWGVTDDTLDFGAPTFITPDGFTKAIDSVGTEATMQTVSYRRAVAGATGDVTCTVESANGFGFAWAAVLIGLKPLTPVITLSATFPSNLHVGDTGSFVVTATLVDGATGTLTITGSSLPDGMTLGSTTDNGDGTFTATVSYDLTTVQDVTASFSATGGSVAATALVHEFDVAAAASTPHVAQYARAYSPTGTAALTFGASSTGAGDAWSTPQSGSVLLLQVAGSTGLVGYTPGAGWNVIDNSMLTGASGTPRAVMSFWKYADGTESSITIAAAFVGSLYEISDAHPTAPIHKAGGNYAADSDATVTFGPQTPTVTNTLAIGAATWRADAGNSATTPAGWTQEPPNNLRTGTVNLYCFVQAQDGSLAAVSGTTTISASSTDYGTYLILIAPP